MISDVWTRSRNCQLAWTSKDWMNCWTSSCQCLPGLDLGLLYWIKRITYGMISRHSTCLA